MHTGVYTHCIRTSKLIYARACVGLCAWNELSRYFEDYLLALYEVTHSKTYKRLLIPMQRMAIGPLPMLFRPTFEKSNLVPSFMPMALVLVAS